MQKIRAEFTILLLITILFASIFVISASVFSSQKNIANTPIPTLQQENPTAHFSYEGKILYRTNNPVDAIYVYDIKNDATERVETPNIYDALHIRDTFSADGEWQVFTRSSLDGENQLVIRKRSNDWEEVLFFDDKTISAPAWSPAGKEIAYVLDEAEIHVYDMSSGIDKKIVTEKSVVTQLSWSPDGEHLVYGLNEEDAGQIWVVSSRTRQKNKIVTATTNNQSPVWGKSLSVSENDTNSSAEAYLGNITCLEDGSFEINFLVRNLAPNENIIRRIEVFVNGVKAYRATQIESAQISESINLFFAGAENRDRNVVIILDVWDTTDHYLEPIHLERNGDCPPGENIPGSLISALPDEQKRAVYIPSQSDAANSPEFDLEDLRNKILFQSDRDGVSTLFMMDADGENLTKLGNAPLGEYQYRLFKETGSFSSVWSKAIFSKTLKAGESALFIFDLNSGWAWQLTDLPGSEKEAVWSPNGQQIAYVSEGGKRAEIMIRDMETNNNIRISPQTEDTCGSPSWSPTSMQVVFWCENAYGARQLWISDTTGENLAKLSDPAHNDWDPVWVSEAVPLTE